MHDTAMNAGKLFANKYAKNEMVVLDVGGLNVNGTLRNIFENIGCKFISLDIQEDRSVDIAVKQFDSFPFQDNYFDIVISTSCFEHDAMFWITFREMSRVVKSGGYLYTNVPSAGPYHAYPDDCWRFYKDYGTALETWSHFKINNTSYPVKLISQHFENGVWKDNVCVWQKL